MPAPALQHGRSTACCPLPAALQRCKVHGRRGNAPPACPASPAADCRAGTVQLVPAGPGALEDAEESAAMDALLATPGALGAFDRVPLRVGGKGRAMRGLVLACSATLGLEGGRLAGVSCTVWLHLPHPPLFSNSLSPVDIRHVAPHMPLM